MDQTHYQKFNLSRTSAFSAVFAGKSPPWPDSEDVAVLPTWGSWLDFEPSLYSSPDPLLDALPDPLPKSPDPLSESESTPDPLSTSLDLLSVSSSDPLPDSVPDSRLLLCSFPVRLLCVGSCHVQVICEICRLIQRTRNRTHIIVGDI